MCYLFFLSSFNLWLPVICFFLNKLKLNNRRRHHSEGNYIDDPGFLRVSIDEGKRDDDGDVNGGARRRWYKANIYVDDKEEKTDSLMKSRIRRRENSDENISIVSEPLRRRSRSFLCLF